MEGDEAQPSMEDVSEVKGEEICSDEVKGEDVTGDEAVDGAQGGSGDGDVHVKTVEDEGVNEDQSAGQSDHGGGDSHPNEEAEEDGEQGESAVEEKKEDDEQKDDAACGENEAQSEGKVEQGGVSVEDELRQSKTGDEGDEIVSSKVTTVSFASEVQVLNEDEMEEEWTTAGGDNEEDGAKEVHNDDGDPIDESLEKKAEIVENADNEASGVQESNAEEAERDEDAVEQVTAGGDGRVGSEPENIPVVEGQADEEEQPPQDVPEVIPPIEEAAAADVEVASEEVYITATEQNQAVESEQHLPESKPEDGSEMAVDVSAVEDLDMTEQDPEASQEQGEDNGDGKLDEVPVLLMQQEIQEEPTPEYVEVVHRSMKSSAPEVMVEATLEESAEQITTEDGETTEGEGKETNETVTEEVVTEHADVGEETDIDKYIREVAPEDSVGGTVLREHTSQEDYESGHQEQMPDQDEAIGAEVDDDGDHQDNQDGVQEGDDVKEGEVDNYTELEADGAVQDESQTNVENQGQLCVDQSDPSEAAPYETDPNLSSVNQEDVPLDGSFSEYEQQPMLPSDVEPLPPIEPEVVRQDIHQLQEQQRIEGLSPIELLTQANQAHGVLPTPLRSPYHQQHPRSGSKLESTSRATSLSRVQIARIPSPPAHIKAQMSMDEERRASTRTSSRLPPSVMKMSSVMVNARKKAVKNRGASVYYEERQFSKILTLDECINSRPPMPFDLDTPGPCRYSPRNKPLYEDNAPEYSFGVKFPERGGGGRTAYAKTWFNSHDNFTVKTRFERRWPSPNAYGRGRSMVGRKVPDKKDYPAFSMRGKTNFVINKKDDTVRVRGVCVRRFKFRLRHLRSVIAGKVELHLDFWVKRTCCLFACIQLKSVIAEKVELQLEFLVKRNLQPFFLLFADILQSLVIIKSPTAYHSTRLQ